MSFPISAATPGLPFLCKRGVLLLVLAALFPLLACAQEPAGAPEPLTWKVEPFYKYRKDGQPGRVVTLRLKDPRYKGPFTVTATCNALTETTVYETTDTANTLSVLLPAGAGVEQATRAEMVVAAGDRKWSALIEVPLKRQWTVYIYPHSHVDIGYTNVQEVVEQLHVRNIDVGIDLARKTQHYPEGARFVWNPEATWVVNSYLKGAGPEKKKLFIEAVRKGWVRIDGTHSNINTSACSDEELLRMFQNNHAIEALTGVPVTTMVQVDNPGGGWGLVQAAAQNGIRAFFSFPNYYDLRRVWDHKPFYWVAQNGKDRVFFLQPASYGWGYRLKGSKYGLALTQSLKPEYDRVSTKEPGKNFIDPFIFEETQQLEQLGSPYDLYAMTWSMADNCLIDADLPEAVRQWNENYAYPKLVISGIKEIYEAYEKKYGSLIPEYRGDFTEFWTNGLGSDARRVGMGRRGKEALVQAETLWPLINPSKPAPVDSFDACWENVLLASEHTWGYQNPGAPMAKLVEANKAAFFEKAEAGSRQLVHRALETVEQKGGGSIAVINTLAWARGGLVTLSAEQSRAGDRVLDERGREVLSQRLSGGALLFQAQGIPALGSRLYRVVPGTCTLPSELKAGTNSLQNGTLSVVLDGKTGNITSLIDRKSGRELVKQSPSVGINSYHYLLGVRNGRDSTFTTGYASSVSIELKEQGPLLVSLLVRAQAEGCRWLTREVRLAKDQPYLELVNTLDKIATRKKEGIHFGFDFNIPSGTVRMDIPFGTMSPNSDQVAGANKNWFTFQRFVDISNEEYGVAWNCIESPLVELGGLTGNILDGARQPWNWIRTLAPTQTLYSWPLNNHWNTNFPLEQGGIMSFTYQVLPHGAYDPVVTNRFGFEQHRPLVAVETARNPLGPALVSIDNPAIMISALKKSRDNKAIILRLRSVSDQPQQVRLTWPAATPRAVYSCSTDEQPIRKSRGTTTVLPYGFTSFRIEF